MFLSRRSVVGLGLWSSLLLCGLWCDAAFAWQPRGSDGRQQPNNPKNATATLEKRLEQEKSGRELFVRDWSQPDAKPAAGGDGLGPMYNDVSCVACHQLGGIGGAGKEDKNVRLLHLVGGNGVPLRTSKTGERELKRRQEVHPGFLASTTVMLHRHERDKEISDQGYQTWMAKRLPNALVDRWSGLSTNHPSSFRVSEPAILRSPLESASGTFRSEGLPVRLTERNTTSLFGTGLIDSIPDSAIVEQAERQKKQHAPLITGRVPQTATGAVGRFGWRGQVATLQEFVMAACSQELGLTVPGHAQPPRVLFSNGKATSFGADQSGQPNDLTQEQCDALTSYIAGLSAPTSARAATLDQAKSIQRGNALFEKAGCAICHVPDVGPAVGLYSDMLLHDLGPHLSDPLPAIPELDEHIIPGSPGSAYGQSFRIELAKNITTNIHQEWRTPPLWGVADSGPYLHDGRAATLEQAIQWHSGEAQRASEAFRAFKPDERKDLVQFLQSLTAPADLPVTLPRTGLGGGGFF